MCANGESWGWTPEMADEAGRPTRAGPALYIRADLNTIEP
jgi:hypothetical protein